MILLTVLRPTIGRDEDFVSGAGMFRVREGSLDLDLTGLDGSWPRTVKSLSGQKEKRSLTVRWSRWTGPEAAGRAGKGLLTLDGAGRSQMLGEMGSEDRGSIIAFRLADRDGGGGEGRRRIAGLRMGGAKLRKESENCGM